MDVVSTLRAQGSMSLGEIVKAVNRSERNIHRILQNLIAIGRCEKIEEEFEMRVMSGFRNSTPDVLNRRMLYRLI